MNRLFGTDGIRGKAGVDLTEDLARRVGAAAGRHFAGRGISRVILARDTRASGPGLSSAFLGGAMGSGIDAVDLGIAPTPAVSVLLSRSDVPAFGVVLSASHNPYEDNGIKIFAPDGGKLSSDEESQIEEIIAGGGSTPVAAANGRIVRDTSSLAEYFDTLRNHFPAKLTQTRVVIDAAHGAWAPHAQAIFQDIATDVRFLHCDHSGTDINRGCGSTHLEALDAYLSPPSSIDSGGAVGLAFDGDGDRMLIRLSKPSAKEDPHVPLSPRPLVSPTTVEGDNMLLLFARHRVKDGPVIGTVMSNGALIAALEEMGRPCLRAPVGDREVCDMMRARGSRLGGEQSGHIIFGDFQKTGDGAVTALTFLNIFAQQYGESVERLRADLLTPFPQKLVNVRVAEKRPWEADSELSAAVRAAEEKLGKHGRLVIRYSGTEPLLRIMAEAPDAEVVDTQVRLLTDKFRERLGR